MLTELQGKGGCLCQPAKEGKLRCPLIVRPTSEDVITGNVFQMLGAINPRWWLSQLLNQALQARRFRQQYFRQLRIELWKNRPPYPKELLPWDEGSTQVDVTLAWENPPTTVFIEAKYGAKLSSKSSGDDGRSGFPSDQLIRNARVGLLEAGYFDQQQMFSAMPRDFVLLVMSPFAGHDLVGLYRNVGKFRQAIPCHEQLSRLPREPFIGEFSYATLIGLLSEQLRFMTRVERVIVNRTMDYLRFKLAQVPRATLQRHLQIELV